MRLTAIRLIMMVLLAALHPNASWSFEVPELTPNVTDRAGVLSATEISDLNGTIARLRSESHIYAAVLIVRSTRPETIEQAAIQTFDRWQLGEKGVDNGLLLLVAIDDRRVRIEVGYGLEGAIPDVNAKRIIDDVIAPDFKKGLYFRGLSEALLICNDLVLHGESFRIKPQSWWSKVTALQKLKAGIWIMLIVFLPIGVRAMAVARARAYSEDLQPTEQESSAWRIALLSARTAQANPSGIVNVRCGSEFGQEQSFARKNFAIGSSPVLAEGGERLPAKLYPSLTLSLTSTISWLGDSKDRSGASARGPLPAGCVAS